MQCWLLRVLHYIPHCHAKLYVMVHELYYILCMKSCTSCQLNELREHKFSIRFMHGSHVNASSWLQTACSKTCLVEPERLHT